MKDLSDYKLVRFLKPECPEQGFYLCDMDEGNHFLDPLMILYRKDHNPIEELDGLYAYGGKISAETLIESYKFGIFPWSGYRDPEIHWHCPHNRFVIFPQKIHISHSMRNLINKKPFKITFNKAFEEVIRHCSEINNRHLEENAWLGEEIIKAFTEIHSRGMAGSVEVWQDGKLAGGLYGFWYNGVFQGDSMFSAVPSASKYALIELCKTGVFNGDKIKFIDCQIKSPLFDSMGAEYISYKDFRKALDHP